MCGIIMHMIRHAWNAYVRLPLGLAVMGLVLALLFSLLLPFQRASTMRVLITQPSAAGLDPYTAIKSTERVASSLAELIYTTTFFDSVLSQAKGVDANYFPQDEQDRREAWRKTIETSITPGTGIMTVSALHRDPAQARLIVDAVTRQMAAQTPNYFGYNMRVQIIDAPLDSRWFVRPQFGQNGLVGFMIGLLFGLILVLVRLPKTVGLF